MNRRMHAVGMSILAVVLLSMAACQRQTKPFESTQEIKTATATIQAVSQSDRHLVLQDAQGNRMMVEAGPAVRNFEQVRPGDRIVVRYREGILAEVKPRAERGQDAESTITKGRVATPGTPGGMAGTSIATTVRIDSVNYTANTVTFRRPDGIERTVAVESPDAKRFVSGLKAGDEVQVTYTEAVAVSIEPADA